MWARLTFASNSASCSAVMGAVGRSVVVYTVELRSRVCMGRATRATGGAAAVVPRPLGVGGDAGRRLRGPAGGVGQDRPRREGVGQEPAADQLGDGVGVLADPAAGPAAERAPGAG